MRRIFASVCLTASMAFLVAGCGGEDPEVTKNDPIIVEIISFHKEMQKAVKDPSKIDPGKLMDQGLKMSEKMEKFSKLPKNVQDKLIAKHKAEWDDVLKSAKK